MFSKCPVLPILAYMCNLPHLEVCLYIHPLLYIRVLVMFCNPITNHGAASGERHLVIMLMDTQLRYDDHARTHLITLNIHPKSIFKYMYCIGIR